jgi:hypothetical protein
MNRLAALLATMTLLGPGPAAAQTRTDPFQVGIQFGGALSSEFDRTDFGGGGRFAWHPTEVLGVESQIDFYPNDFAGSPPFSRSRLEGMFGLTAGPRFGRLRPFARVRPGFVQFREAPRPFACILIFPPPLACALASGGTVFALDLGGGVEVASGGPTFVRIDAGDRVMRYPGPAFDSDRTRHDEAFFSHDFRMALGAGFRF